MHYYVSKVNLNELIDFKIINSSLKTNNYGCFMIKFYDIL